MPGFPFVPLLYILSGLSILVLGLLEQPVPSLIAVLTVLLGIPAFYVFKKRYENRKFNRSSRAGISISYKKSEK